MLSCHSDAAFGQDRLDVNQAETEHVIQPDGMADNLGGKPMSRIRGGGRVSCCELRPPVAQAPMAVDLAIPPMRMHHPLGQWHSAPLHPLPIVTHGSDMIYSFWDSKGSVPISHTVPHKCFRLVLIKPSHYDDDGYVIQW